MDFRLRERERDALIIVLIIGILIMGCALAILILTDQQPSTVGEFDHTKKVYMHNNGPETTILMEEQHGNGNEEKVKLPALMRGA